MKRRPDTLREARKRFENAVSADLLDEESMTQALREAADRHRAHLAHSHDQMIARPNVIR